MFDADDTDMQLPLIIRDEIYLDPIKLLLDV